MDEIGGAPMALGISQDAQALIHSILFGKLFSALANMGPAICTAQTLQVGRSAEMAVKALPSTRCRATLP
jgi:hypothetical protein